MSQIDKAFLNAYSRQQVTSPSPESRTIEAPIGDKRWKIHQAAASPVAPKKGPVISMRSMPVPPAPASSPSQPPVEDEASTTLRKTLSSYLQQARHGAGPAPAAIPADSPLVHPPASSNTPPTAAGPRVSISSTIRQHRIDSPHTIISPPVSRPESVNPWQYEGVERGIKGVADSHSEVARMENAAVTAVPLYGPSPAAEPQLRETVASSSEPASRQAKPMEQRRGAEAIPPVSLPIQPYWEVDQFFWPPVVAKMLEEQAEAFHEIGLHFQHAQSKGLKTLSITSGERGVGKSTVAMCLAKTLSRIGMRIALLDGNGENPSLYDQLNLEVQYGWQQCLLENVPLEEVAIQSMEERLTFFPLTSPFASTQIQMHQPRINKLLKRIAAGCDMLIIDSHRLTHHHDLLFGTGPEKIVDAALVMVDAELSLRQRVDTAIEMVRAQGIQSVGLAENFLS